jgi:hypothetical protein
MLLTIFKLYLLSQLVQLFEVPAQVKQIGLQ